jgi:hypothetical protein
MREDGTYDIGDLVWFVQPLNECEDCGDEVDCDATKLVLATVSARTEKGERYNIIVNDSGTLKEVMALDLDLRNYK